MRQVFILFLIAGIGFFPGKDAFSQANNQQLNGHDEISCGTDKAMEQLYNSHTEALKEAKEFEEFTKKMIREKGLKASNEYIIPVVFHVFGTVFNSGTTVTDFIIKNALQKTNEDFQGLTADWNTVASAFEPVKAPLNITFVLAELDPDGNPTTGINYYANTAGFGNGSGYDSQIQAYAWDNYKYMNVYIMRDLYDDDVTNNSGVSWYPDKWMSDNNLARVVYNGSYLGSNTNENFRSVLTHEFGHWLNLKHPFEGNCTFPNDGVEDTPPTTSNNGSCNTTIERCPGYGVPNGENFMDYTECYKMYTQGQVDRMIAALEYHITRKPLWQKANLIATVPTTVLPGIYPATNTFFESLSNDGSIDTIYLYLQEEAFTINNGVMTENTHYTVTSLSSGLSLEVTGTSDTTAFIAINGNADNHLDADNIDSLTITFLNASLVGNDTSVLYVNPLLFAIDFMNPYRTHYQDLNDLPLNSSQTWTSFSLDNDPDYPQLPEFDYADYGIWYNAGNLRFETYTKALVCEGATKNISPLPYGTEINASSNWVEGGDYPDEHNIRTSAFTDWDGQEAYIGFKLEFEKSTHYGWFRVTVAANGQSYILHDYAYQLKPDEPISAGDKGTCIVFSSEDFSESTANDGSISTVIYMELHEDSLSVASGVLSENIHYTMSNLPDGLTMVITATSDTTATLEITGTATSHDDDIKDLTISFLDAVFKNGPAYMIQGSVNNIFSILFITPEINVSGNTFTEKSSSPGSISNTITITLTDCSFSKSSGTLTEATDYTVTNLPDGLTPEITVVNSTSANFKLTGIATNHYDEDDVSDLTLNFLDHAFDGITASNIDGSTNVFTIDFLVLSGISDNENNSDLAIYPVPNSGSFNIKLNNSYRENLTVNLINMNGQNVWKRKLTKQNDELLIFVEADNLPEGLYTVQLISNMGIMNSKIIIKK